MQTQLSLILSNQDKSSGPTSFGVRAQTGTPSDSQPSTHPFRMELKAIREGLGQEGSAAKTIGPKGPEGSKSPELAAPEVSALKVPSAHTAIAPIPPADALRTQLLPASLLEGNTPPAPLKKAAGSPEFVDTISGPEPRAGIAPIAAPITSEITLAASHDQTAKPAREALLSKAQMQAHPALASASASASSGKKEASLLVANGSKAAAAPSGNTLPSGKNAAVSSGKNLPLGAIEKTSSQPTSPLANKGDAKKMAGLHETRRNAKMAQANGRADVTASAPTPTLAQPKAPLAQVALGNGVNTKQAAGTDAKPLATAPQTTPQATLAPSSRDNSNSAPIASKPSASFYPDAGSKQAAASGERVVISKPIEHLISSGLAAERPASAHSESKGLVASTSGEAAVRQEFQAKPAAILSSHPAIANRKLERGLRLADAAKATHPARIGASGDLKSDPSTELAAKTVAETTQKIAVSAPKTVAQPQIQTQNQAPPIPNAGGIPLAQNGVASEGLTLSGQTSAIAGQADAPDLEGLVEKLSAARVLARADKSSMSINHPDFGKVTMEFSTGTGSRLGLDMPDAPAELRQAVAQNFAQNTAANNAAASAARSEAPRGEAAQARSDQAGQNRSDSNDAQNSGSHSDANRGNASGTSREQAQQFSQNPSQNGGENKAKNEDAQTQPSKSTQGDGSQSFTTKGESAVKSARGAWA